MASSHYETRNRTALLLRNLQTFGMPGYMDTTATKLRMAPDAGWIILGITQNHRRRTLRALNISTGQIIKHHNISLHPTRSKKGGISYLAAEPEGGKDETIDSFP